MNDQPQREFRIVGRTEEDEANAKAIDVAPQAPILKLGVVR
jgi:hypothetical protein